LEQCLALLLADRTGGSRGDRQSAEDQHRADEHRHRTRHAPPHWNRLVSSPQIGTAAYRRSSAGACMPIVLPTVTRPRGGGHARERRHHWGSHERPRGRGDRRRRRGHDAAPGRAATHDGAFHVTAPVTLPPPTLPSTTLPPVTLPPPTL